MDKLEILLTEKHSGKDAINTKVNGSTLVAGNYCTEHNIAILITGSNAGLSITETACAIEALESMKELIINQIIKKVIRDALHPDEQATQGHAEQKDEASP